MDAAQAEIQAEDRFIRALILIGSTIVVLGFLTVATVIAVMVSMNFNIMTWLE